ncbi:sugar transferase [Patescibacteria group bacterium]|nr:sugar transferase [Patescibacteria group bacterium]
MTYGGRPAVALLFLGDIAVFAAALWLTLLVRYAQIPTETVLIEHIRPFTVLFILWTLIFYMSGLYGKRMILSQGSLSDALLKTQSFNIVLAALFFFLVPGISIAPKTNLIIYLVISMVLIFIWRLFVYPQITIPRNRARAILLATGDEAVELMEHVNANPRYQLQFDALYNPDSLKEDGLEAIKDRFEHNTLSVIVADTEHIDSLGLLPALYALPCFEENVKVLEFAETYEDVFDRIPLSQISHAWFLQNVKADISLVHGIVKRGIDICGALVMGAVTILATPFVAVLLQLEYPGAVFITQDRLGVRGTRIRTYKFRSMRFGDRSAWSGEDENKVTRVGSVLRKISLDEFPQFINVLRGEMSLIGPRNDLVSLGERLGEALPYYMKRYIALPGITGWAQINQQYEQGNISPQSIDETKVRLAYDFYYLKNQSLGLDLVIMLKTVKRMFFRVSSW